MAMRVISSTGSEEIAFCNAKLTVFGGVICSLGMCRSLIHLYKS